MTKFLTAMLFALLLPTTAGAGTIYQFHTTQAAVGAPDLVADPGSAFDGVDLTLHLFDSGPIVFEGDGCGFEATGIGAIRLDGWAIPLCYTEPEYPDIPMPYAWLALDLQPRGALLVGTFDLYSWEETFIMTSNPGGGRWTGTYTSDFGDDGCYWSPTPCTFTGLWRRVGPAAAQVPEPGTLVLTVVGLGGLLTVRRHGARSRTSASR